ncbi:hypothetical protein [Streptomyces sp. NPDC018693]|uniref:hypothetical protein n=1 Tax=unclassified Streptomyces TaxID=2593676 RepID=UPI00378AF5A7
MDREEHVCPACGQPVESVVQRYKTLGAWVPRWVAGPCHNPDCEAYVPQDAEHEQRPAQEQERDQARDEQDAREPEHDDTGSRRR